MDQTTAAVDVRDVCFAYGDQEVLHNVSFSIARQELVAIVGPNGGGKTTLLKLLLGELKPRFGHIGVLGEDPADARSSVGYVPQAIPFDPSFPVSVREVVLMGRVAKARLGLFGKTDHEAAEAALAKVGMSGFAGRAFAQISGGERQRVMIAQALAGGSEMLFFDEPVANVDPEHASQLYNLFKELTFEGITVLMVSHNLGVVTVHATQILCVNRTAGMHAIGELASQTFTEAFGGSLTAIRHEADCHVLDPSSAMHAPHHGQVKGMAR
ncbi:MAG: metal ABC transporter ATP-binding protein [Kiritimatiellae bacterium]|nr:metal ABC transporter ATP-binding protein [Kiritimatiellia bacterium]